MQAAAGNSGRALIDSGELRGVSGQATPRSFEL